MTKIAVVGYKGKMGSVVFGKLKQHYDVIGIDLGDDIELAKSSDVVIDFGGAECSTKTACWCERNNKKLIIGSTGQTKKQQKIIERCAKKISIIMAGNFSLGIYKLKQCLKLLLDGNEVQVNIIEKHHIHKKDKPSGTALEIAQEIKKYNKKNADIFSIRAGDEVGTHEVNIYLQGEMISIKHKAFSRECFAVGVLASVDFLEKNAKSGIYSLKDVLK